MACSFRGRLDHPKLQQAGRFPYAGNRILSNSRTTERGGSVFLIQIEGAAASCALSSGVSDEIRRIRRKTSAAIQTMEVRRRCDAVLAGAERPGNIGLRGNRHIALRYQSDPIR